MAPTKITVVDVFRAMGIPPVKDDTWSISRKTAAIFRDEHGEYPPTEYRDKTNGSGQHQMAVYAPHPWFGRIRALILEAKEVERQQGDLFGEPKPEGCP
jgi:hypothetical protein